MINRLTAINQQLLNKKTELSTLQSQLAALTLEITPYTCNFEQLQLQLSELKSTHEELKKDLIKYMKFPVELMQTLPKLYETLMEPLRKSLAEKQADNAQLKGKCNNLEQQNQELRKKWHKDAQKSQQYEQYCQDDSFGPHPSNQELTKNQCQHQNSQLQSENENLDIFVANVYDAEGSRDISVPEKIIEIPEQRVSIDNEKIFVDISQLNLNKKSKNIKDQKETFIKKNSTNNYMTKNSQKKETQHTRMPLNPKSKNQQQPSDKKFSLSNINSLESIKQLLSQECNSLSNRQQKASEGYPSQNKHPIQRSYGKR